MVTPLVSPLRYEVFVLGERYVFGLRGEAMVQGKNLISDFQSSLANLTMPPRPGGLGWDRAAPSALGAVHGISTPTLLTHHHLNYFLFSTSYFLF